MKTPKLTYLEKVGFGQRRYGDQCRYIFDVSDYLLLLYRYFGLKPSHMGILFLVARLMDAVTDPLMGIITDKFNTRYGRYRPYFLIFSVPFGISGTTTFYYTRLEL